MWAYITNNAEIFLNHGLVKILDSNIKFFQVRKYSKSIKAKYTTSETVTLYFNLFSKVGPLTA